MLGEFAQWQTILHFERVQVATQLEPAAARTTYFVACDFDIGPSVAIWVGTGPFVDIETTPTIRVHHWLNFWA